MRALVIAAVGLVALLPVAAADTFAAPIACQPQPADGPGDCSGTMSYSAALDGLSAILSFTLNNDSAPEFGGFLTALVFNNPDNKVTAVGSSTGQAGWTAALDLSDTNNIFSGQPFGIFDFLVGTGGGFEGGGPPSAGIPAGGSATFTLSLSGTDLDTLTEESFRSTFSVTPEGASTGIWGAVRYRGFSSGAPGGESDKDPIAGVSTETTQEVPAPMSLILLGLGTIGLGTFARRKFQR